MTATTTTARPSDPAAGGRSFQRRHDLAVACEFAAQPLVAMPTLTEADLAHLPAPVRRYVARSGAVGRPRLQNVRVVFDALMWRKRGAPPMRSVSVQYNFFGRPARLFLMQARMFGLPTRALHIYREEAATFQVRVASLVNVVDQSGDAISSAETVTVLNDMCFFAPASLVDPRLTWESVDERNARATFANGRRRVSAMLVFDERDELVDFWSDDRPDSSGGVFIPRRWNTPIDDYGEIDGRHLARHGTAVWAYPDGPFTYGDFRVRSIRYDVAGPTSM
jgi:hypothetical protein